MHDRPGTTRQLRRIDLLKLTLVALHLYGVKGTEYNDFILCTGYSELRTDIYIHHKAL